MSIKFILGAVVILSLASSAEAAVPKAPLAAAGASDIQLAAGGCGPGWRRSLAGHCERAMAMPGGCQNGWHFSRRFRRCRPN